MCCACRPDGLQGTIMIISASGTDAFKISANLIVNERRYALTLDLRSEAALAEGHDVVASARCAGGTDCKERCHEIDPCRTSCSGHGIDRGAAHQPLFQGHAGQHRRRDQHRLSRTFIWLAMYVPAEVTARTSADFLIPGIKTDVYTIFLD